MDSFNPDNNFLQSEGIFGLPFTYDDAKLILIPVPWEVTCSYGDGTCKAPDAIYKASFQIDLFDHNLGEEWKKGIYLDLAPEYIYDDNAVQRRFARQIIHHLETESKPLNDRQTKQLDEVNKVCDGMNAYVAEKSTQIHTDGKISGLVGGDHSAALEHIKAVAKREKEIAVIQIDAHADLRESYMGFTHSHASLMNNLAKDATGITKVIQLGLRDICKAEADLIQSSPLFSAFFMNDIRQWQYEGKKLKDIYSDIIKDLPDKVYISLDIDGLDPSLCPNTGTPVPGGFDFYEVVFLFAMLHESGKKIAGFDLCEVGISDNSEWDANVAARLLYQLCLYTLRSNG
ncbi:MAG: agmatinase [Marinilabiliales bacterium]|nr:MAG: agmatinase [Marinilabiliales bacterium]